MNGCSFGLQQNKFFGILALPGTYDESSHRQINFSYRLYSCNRVFHKILLSKNALLDFDMAYEMNSVYCSWKLDGDEPVICDMYTLTFDFTENCAL